MYGRFFYIAISLWWGMVCAYLRLHPLTFILIGSLILYLRKSPRVLQIISVVSFLFGALLFAAVDSANKTKLSKDQHLFKGTITSLPYIDGNRLSMRFQVAEQEEVQLSYTIRSKEEKEKLSSLMVGNRCTVSGTLTVPKGQTNPGGFDYAKYLYRENIHWLLKVDKAMFYTCKKPTYSFISSLHQWRKEGINHTEHLFPDESAGIVNALLFGEQRGIDEQIQQAYQSLGIIHLLAISGGHVSLLFAAFLFVLLRLGITREKALSIMVVMLPIYAVLTGASPSVVRACTMAFIFCFVLKFRLHVTLLDTISLTFILMVMINPYAWFHIGFQLSFVGSFFLLVSVEGIFSKTNSYLKQLFLVSLISELAAFPLIVYHFYEISLLSLITNLFYVPIVSFLLLPLSIFIFSLSFISYPLSVRVAQIFDHILHFFHSLFIEMQQWTVFTIRYGEMSIVLVLLLYLFIFYLLLTIEHQKQWRHYSIPVLGLLLICFLQYVWVFFKPYGEVIVLDVGQGECVIIDLPYRKGVYMIDTGGTLSFDQEEWKQKRKRFEVGKDVVVPALKAKGIRTIDKLILTHGDYDHIGGVQALMNHVNIHEVIYPNQPLQKPFEKALLNQFTKQNTKVTFAYEGLVWEKEQARFMVINPPENEVTTQNDGAVVISVRLGGTYFLFTGDLEKKGEYAIMKKYPDLKTDVLKAGHHGSATSTSKEWLTFLNPKLVYLSVGENNRYGHPHPTVIASLKEQHIPYIRTDQQGGFRYLFYDHKPGKLEWFWEKKEYRGDAGKKRD